jgi:hypothetical protein
MEESGGWERPVAGCEPSWFACKAKEGKELKDGLTPTASNMKTMQMYSASNNPTGSTPLGCAVLHAGRLPEKLTVDRRERRRKTGLFQIIQRKLLIYSILLIDFLHNGARFLLKAGPIGCRIREATKNCRPCLPAKMYYNLLPKCSVCTIVYLR